MKRNGLVVTPKQLRDLADSLISDMEDWLFETKESKENQECIVNIINKQGYKDTWRLE